MPTSNASTESGGSVEADPRWLPVGIAAAALATLFVVAIVALVHTGRAEWNTLDLAVYRWGGQQAWTGGDLYGGTYPAMAEMGDVDSDLPFTYTPLAALFFIPLYWLPSAAAQGLMVVVDLAALAVIVVVSLRSLGYRSGPGRLGMTLTFTAAALALEPVAQTVGLGQVNLVLAALCLWDLCLPDDSRVKGVGVGLATAVKLTPGLFVVFLLASGQRRAAVRAGLTAIGATVLAFALLWGPSWEYWIGGVFRDAGRVGSLAFVGNQSLNGVLARLLRPSGIQQAVWLALALLVLAAALVTAARWHRQGHRLVAVLVVAMAGLLISPVSWTHHWVWIVPVAVVGVDAVRRGVPWAGWLLAGMLLPFVSPGILWQMPFKNDQEHHWNAVQVVVGNAYVWVGLAVLGLAWSLRPGRQAPAAAPEAPGPDQGPDRAVPPAGWPSTAEPR